MKIIVKKTTKIRLLDWLCPYYCRCCGRLGSVLCDCCKKNIFSIKNDIKVDFDEEIFDNVWVSGWRDEILGKLVEEYKYQSVRKIKNELIEVLDKKIPKIVGEVVIVPLPTISKHIRERGFDHTLMVARGLAKKRGWCCQKLLVRNNNTVQVGASMKKRQEQAKNAYYLNGQIDNNKMYMLLDDVWTTGASMQEAGKIMRSAGVKKLVASVIVVSK